MNTKIMMKEIKTPIGKFIIDNAVGVELADGVYYHYTEVIKLLKLYKNKPPKKPTEQLSEHWVEYKKEKPIGEAYYQTKVADEYIMDFWNGTDFTFNDNLLTHWKRK